jgi:signal transduction histidine kinase
MGSVSITFRTWHNTISSILQRRADYPDFVWLARFRILIIYTILKGLFIVIAGVLGSKLSFLLSPPALSLTMLLWIGIILGVSISILLLITGLVLASRARPRSLGLVLLGASDVCIVLAVLYASILDKPIVLLIVLVFISCTTPLLIERISRYAQRFLRSNYELANLKNERDFLLFQFSQQLVRAIERERQSLKREIHDGLMQELSALMLEVSVMIMRNSTDGILQLSALEVARLEEALRRTVAEARKMMYDLQPSQLVLEKY